MKVSEGALSYLQVYYTRLNAVSVQFHPILFEVLKYTVKINIYTSKACEIGQGFSRNFSEFSQSFSWVLGWTMNWEKDGRNIDR